MAQLLDYHQREAKPQWWEWFFHLELSDDELVEDGDTIGRLELVGEPELDRQSLVYTLTFPPQEHKIDHRRRRPAHGEVAHGVGRRRGRRRPAVAREEPRRGAAARTG